MGELDHIFDSLQAFDRKERIAALQNDEAH